MSSRKRGKKKRGKKKGDEEATKVPELPEDPRASRPIKKKKKKRSKKKKGASTLPELEEHKAEPAEEIGERLKEVIDSSHEIKEQAAVERIDSDNEPVILVMWNNIPLDSKHYNIHYHIHLNSSGHAKPEPSGGHIIDWTRGGPPPNWKIGSPPKSLFAEAMRVAETFYAHTLVEDPDIIQHTKDQKAHLDALERAYKEKKKNTKAWRIARGEWEVAKWKTRLDAQGKQLMLKNDKDVVVVDAEEPHKEVPMSEPLPFLEYKEELNAIRAYLEHNGYTISGAYAEMMNDYMYYDQVGAADSYYIYNDLVQPVQIGGNMQYLVHGEDNYQNAEVLMWLPLLLAVSVCILFACFCAVVVAAVLCKLLRVEKRAANRHEYQPVANRV